jgi:transposase InsO family protein
MKNEMFYGKNWMGVTVDEFIQEVNAYVLWYNAERIKGSLGWLSPLEYRRSLGLVAC